MGVIGINNRPANASGRRINQVIGNLISVAEFVLTQSRLTMAMSIAGRTVSIARGGRAALSRGRTIGTLSRTAGKSARACSRSVIISSGVVMLVVNVLEFIRRRMNGSVIRTTDFCGFPIAGRALTPHRGSSKRLTTAAQGGGQQPQQG